MAEENIMLAENDSEYTLIDVVEAAKNMGLNSINVQTLRNFLLLNDEYFDSDDYGDFIDIINEIRVLYYNPVAEELFGKTADKLTEAERYDVIDAMSNEDRRAILDIHTESMRDWGIVASTDIDTNGYVCWYWSVRGASTHAGEISYYTEHGTAPDPVEGLTVTEEHLPTITADDYVHTGWVDYIGDPVEVGQVFSYSPTLVAVWEEDPNKAIYTIKYQTEYVAAPSEKTVVVNVGESYILTESDLPTLNVYGYTFKGWTINGSLVSAGDSIEADIVLVALWKVYPSIEESKGDGFTLFNGVKLPSLPAYDTEKYKHAVIAEAKNTYLLIVSNLEYVYDGIGLCRTGSHTRCLFRQSAGAEYWATVQIDQETDSGVFPSSHIAFWANYDIINTTDNSVHLAASEPIVLDGMNVIEWDGNTEGLELFPNRTDVYHIADVTDIDIEKQCLVRTYRPNIGTYKAAEFLNPTPQDGYYAIYSAQYIAEASDMYPKTGVYAVSNNRMSLRLFAYYPIEREPTDDMSKGKLFLLSRMFSKPIFHAMTSKWFWYE